MYELFSNVYHDLIGDSISEKERSRDLETVRSRYHAEGEGFFTKVLPQLGKAADKALAQGVPLQTEAFARRPKSQLPRFLGGLFEVVFHTDGVQRELHSDACREAAVRALKALRQLCFLYYKKEHEPTNEQTKRVLADFVATDRGLPDDFTHLNSHHSAVLHKARDLIHEVLCGADPKSGIPRHGPGAVSTGERRDEKDQFKRIYTALTAEYPLDEWFFFNQSHVCDSYKELESWESHETGTAKVVLVPKDSRGPRLISCEPLEYQWIQQSQMSVLVQHLERHPYTRGKVNFTDQSVNQRLAALGSLRNEWDTLDLSEASDRVSVAMLKALFPDNWVRALMASRSSATKLPDGRVVTLKKFAPMGSAVCFPVEALCFWALCVAVQCIQGHRSRKTVMNETFVYGDDIVVRCGNHAAIDQLFNSVGLKLNAKKCCVGTTFFRESCGFDAFHGQKVTPLRWRATSVIVSASNLATTTAFSNAAWSEGWVRTARYLEERIRASGFYVPVVPTLKPSCIAFVRPEFRLGAYPWMRTKVRHCKRTFKPLVYGPMVRAQTVRSARSGWSKLLQHHVERLRSDRAPSEFSGEYPLANRNSLKFAWMPATD